MIMIEKSYNAISFFCSFYIDTYYVSKIYAVIARSIPVCGLPMSDVKTDIEKRSTIILLNYIYLFLDFSLFCSIAH